MPQAPELLCPGCGEAIDINSLKEGDLMECASCADLTLKLVRQKGKLALRQIHRVSCPSCDKKLEVPEDAQLRDTMSCCGQTFYLTYEFGAYALE